MSQTLQQVVEEFTHCAQKLGRISVDFMPAAYRQTTQHNKPLFGRISSANKHDTPAKDQQFHAWFNGSLVSDSKGLPIIQYHSSDLHFGNAPFWPFSHFGTASATHRLLRNNPNFYPVLLSIKNPLGLPDLMQHTPEKLTDTLTQKNIITKAEHIRLQRIFHAGAQNQLPPHPLYTQLRQRIDNNDRLLALNVGFSRSNADFHAFDQLATILRKKGYDGLLYRNKIEDPGSLSWCIFSPDQAINAIQIRAKGIRVSSKTSFKIKSLALS